MKLQEIREKAQRELAKKLDVGIEDVQKFSPSELAMVLKLVGKNDFVPDSKFNSKELEMGIEVEMEHTANLIIAKLIAKDHLSELDDYYTRLKKMEEK